MEILIIIVSLLGGLGLFLFGMGIMSETLSKMAGGSLDRVIGTITKNRYIGFLAGAALTGLIQTSSATTVLTVGFVNAGIMKLGEAFGLIVGANLGATANAWILSLNSVQGEAALLALCKPSFFVPLIAFLAVVLSAVAKSDKTKNTATALLGFCVMMTGMMMMSASIGPLKDTPAFHKMLTGFRNPFIAFLAALAFTIVIQSSDATVGIVQAIAMSATLTRGMAIPLVCGAQIGTCITALMSSLGTANNGKRTALLHLYYNVFKTVPFLIVLFILDSRHPIAMLALPATGMWIPAFHSMINIVAAMVYLPLAKFFVKLAELTIPYNTKEKQERESALAMLDPVLLMNAPIALRQVRIALEQFAATIPNVYALFMEKNDEAGMEEIHVLCNRLFRYREQILNYMKEITRKRIDEKYTMDIQNSQNICVSFGRIAELIEETVQIREKMIREGSSFSETANKDLYILLEAVREIVDTTMVDFERENRTLAENIRYFREGVSKLHTRIIARHVKRLHDGICRSDVGVLFMDSCYNFEKIIDACDMVAENLLSCMKPGGTADDAEEEAEEKRKRRESIRRLYEDKYLQLSD